MPWSGPRYCPLAISRSASRARCMAYSGVTVVKHSNCGCRASIRSRVAATSSTGETSRLRRESLISTMVAETKSISTLLMALSLGVDGIRSRCLPHGPLQVHGIHSTTGTSVLSKDARDLPALTGDRQGKRQEKASFLRGQVVSDQKATLRQAGALEGPATARPRRLDHHDTAADRLLERFEVARPTESGGA